jgi:hypothetical protein
MISHEKHSLLNLYQYLEETTYNNNVKHIEMILISVTSVSWQ